MADEVTPYPKETQLARGARRYRRKVASAKQWQRIIAAKGGPCRVCRDPGSNGSVHSAIQFHHLVPRSQGGDDVADNIVPLCQDCHRLATLRNPLVLEGSGCVRPTGWAPPLSLRPGSLRLTRWGTWEWRPW